MNTERLKINIPVGLKQKLDLYIANCKQEISGLGEAIIFNNSVLIQDIFILEQKVSTGSTDLDEAAVAQMLTTMLREGKDPSLVKVWWHSHAKLGCFWSTTDENTIKNFNNGEWLVSIVGNHAGEYLARFDLYSPVRLVGDNLNLSVIVPQPDADLEKTIQEEIKEKVKVQTYVYRPWNRPWNQYSKEIDLLDQGI